ncbi:MAG: TonB-dependent receptor [Synergistes sp.]|nr:TonB-dependent receptor [Synergistes sp.]
MKSVFINGMVTAFALSVVLASPLCAAERQASEDIEEVSAVEVTGSRLAQSTEEVPAQTTVITRKEIESSGARDVQDVISKIPGVDGLQTSASMARDKFVSVRGLASEVLLLIDGMPYMGGNYGVGEMGNPFDLRNIQLADVERIEVVKGAGSAIYGSNAAGGVINVITRKGSDKSSVTVTAEGGNAGWFRGNVQGTAVSGDLKVFAGYTRTQEGETKIKLLDPKTGQYDSSKEYSGNDYRFGFTKGPWAFQTEIGDSYSEWQNTLFGTTSLDSQKNKYKRFTINYADGTNTARAYYYDNEREYTYDKPNTSGFSTLTDYRDKVFGASYNRKFDIGKIPFVAGMDFRRENGSVEMEKASEAYDEVRFEYAPYIETSVAIGEAALDIGLRYEYWNINNGSNQSEIIPRMSLNWENAHGVIYYATVGRYFAMPSFYQMFGDKNSSVLPNTELAPESGWTYDMGIKNPKDRNPWSFNIFYMDMKDKINYEYDPETYIGQYVNIDKYRAWGAEADYKWNINENWSYTQTLAYTHAEEKNGSGDWIRSTTPRWDISGTLAYDTKRWNAEICAHFYGDRHIRNNTSQYSEENIFLVNAAMTWKAKENFKMRLSCVNIFNREYVINNSGNITPERRVILSATYEF